MERSIGKVVEDSVISRQIESEYDAIELGVKRYRRLVREAIGREEGSGLKPAERMVLHWFEPMCEAVKQDQRLILRGEPGVGRGLYGPVMGCLDAARISVITMHTVLSRCMSEPNGDLIPRLAYSVGSAVVAEIHMDLLKKNERASLKDLDRKFKNLNTQRINWWAKKTLSENLWNRKVCIQLGTRLIWSLIGCASSRPYTEPFHLAFHHEKQWRDNQKKGVIRMDDEVFRAIDDGHMFRQGLRPRYKPMLIEPFSWSKKEMGGYVKVRTPFISKPTPDQDEAIQNADMDEFYDSFNALNKQSWTVLTRVLDVFKSIWESGGGAAGVPTRNNRPMPEKPAGIDKDLDKLKEWKSAAHDVYSHNAKVKGQRIEFMQKISLAEELAATAESFFLPHQICFRGRAYPIPLYLHPQGDDIARALLLFGTAREMTERGWYWIRVQACNMWGMDKIPLNARNKWSLDNMSQLRAWARDPLGDQGWMEADKPGQFLTACMALEYPDVAERLPVQIDGSLNGLQHLTAAGMCEVGAKVVNLLPSTPDDVPEDAYIDVADDVYKTIKLDAENGHPVAMWMLPIMQEHGRLLVKQPVMTRWYGCTRIGAREQVKDKLKKLEIQKDRLYPGSKYLGKLTYDGIGTVCGKAADIFNWLETCARIMCKEEPNKSIRWVTPLGLPVVQPYRNWGKVTVKTCLQRVTIAYRKDNVPVHLARQIQGIAANWTHSIDSTHMLMTAFQAVITHLIAFAAVHDSYWTHASDMDLLNEITREQFVLLHERNLLQELVDYWRELYPGLELPDPPEPGKLDINDVKKSTYFFS